ncbi:MAG: conserved hypothetical GTP-binding protein [Actinobacteria bacterium]|nr:conserved hypothetical GTP-binding protein [Actinomycetota bacterium]MBM2828625.1 conserved hypothetical GTP-binding protein [Actinomycetota bacterium]
MSRRRPPSSARLLVSVIYREESRFGEALPALAGRFGPIGCISAAFPFDRTEYYGEEMGSPLFRRFAVIERLVPREALADAKIRAEELEGEFAQEGKRTLNIDPGLLTEENFLLATGKNYSHRVYLRDGVFADLTLVYRKGEYMPLPWTYPDIASVDIRAFLAEVREGLRDARNMESGEPTCG